MKRTRNLSLAAARLAEALRPRLVARRIKGGLFVIRVPGSKCAPTRKRGASAAAFMADVARREGLDVRDSVRWVGTLPSRGMASWEEEALEWLRGAR